MLFIPKRRSFITNEDNVITFISIVNKHAPIGYTHHIGNCGIADRDKWYIEVTITDKVFSKVVKDLNKIGTLTFKENRKAYFERIES